mgnify:CR=1 FL=1
MTLLYQPKKYAEFTALEANGGSIGAGASGDILTVTPPAGQRVRLTHLSTTDIDTAFELSITVSFGLVDIISMGYLCGHAPITGRFSVGSYQPYSYTNPLPPAGSFGFFTGGTDEALVIGKTGSTENTIYYGYEFGE